MIIHYSNKEGKDAVIDLPEKSHWRLQIKKNQADVGMAHDLISFKIMLSYNQTKEQILFLNPLLIEQMGIPAREIKLFAKAIVKEVYAKFAEKAKEINMQDLAVDVYENKGFSAKWVAKGYLEEDSEEESV